MKAIKSAFTERLLNNKRQERLITGLVKNRIIEDTKVVTDESV